MVFPNPAGGFGLVLRPDLARIRRLKMAAGGVSLATLKSWGEGGGRTPHSSFLTTLLVPMDMTSRSLQQQTASGGFSRWAFLGAVAPSKVC